MSAQMAQPEEAFKLGKLYCEKGDFAEAKKCLNQAVSQFNVYKDWEGYLKTQNLLLRIYAEQEDFDNINKVKENLQDLVIKENIELNAKTYYTLALSAFLKGQHSLSLEHLEKSLTLALSNDAKEDICYAINGLAIVYFNLGKYDDALKEIYNLKVFYQVLDLPELKISSQMLNAHVLRKLGKQDEALELYWKCYDQLKKDKVFFQYIALLHSLGNTYMEMGDFNLARVYLDLAKRVVDPNNHKYLAKLIDEKLAELDGEDSSKFDLIFNTSNKSVQEKKKGSVDFKNQFILLDMLRLFLKNPGEVYSKEELVKSVWKQSYDPRVHDNKIYVTIKRLRKMIEPDYEKPKYIFRAKNGYYLNKNTRVLFEH